MHEAVLGILCSGRGTNLQSIVAAVENGQIKAKIGLVLTYGVGDTFDSGGVNAFRSMQDICSRTGAVFAGALYGAANDEGEMGKNVALLEKARAYGAAL